MQPHRPTPLTVQLAIWVGLWAVVFFLLGDGAGPWGRWVRRSTPLLLGVAAVVVLNARVLLPRLYFRGQRTGFVVAGMVLVVGVSLLLQYGILPDRAFPFERTGRLRGGGLTTARFLLPLATSFLGSSLLEVMRYAFYQEKRVIQAQGEQLTTELKFLKSQINPHFLFNSLNNIYTLTLLKDDLAAESLLRLSDMLRYMLYDAETPTVPLRWEIAYIRNYVSLRALKDSRGQNVSLDLDKNRPELLVAPLLLIPFVENAYKHSRIEDRQHGFIRITLVTTAQGLSFTVVNSVPTGPSPVDKAGGIGLENVRKRLDLLYADRYILEITPTPTTFTVTLQLTLPCVYVA